MSKPTVSEVLSNAFRSDFSEATQEQRLLLVEAVAFTMRVGGAWGDNLCTLRYCGTLLPLEIFTPAHLGRNEGSKLLAVLNVAIVEHYSVEAVNRVTIKPSPAVVEIFGSEWVDTEPPSQFDYEFREEFEERCKEWAAALISKGMNVHD